MTDEQRRRVLKFASAAVAARALPPAIGRAVAIPAAVASGTIRDVRHVVILMQENRSFDHYFGTLRGVRGFGDRHPIPLQSGKAVWFQSDGVREILPYHLDSRTTNALCAPGSPHSFEDAQAAWNQGKLGFWPKFKTQYSMGHYQRADIPFQFALAEAFTICDAYHCSITSGTDPNRVMFWSGSSFDPQRRARGENCTDADSEPDNLRCWVTGRLPTPGYTYAGSAFRWPTIPDVLEKAGVSWRIYQDPNDNWTGAMHGGLAFESFRSAQPGSRLYENGMRHWSLEKLAEHVANGSLPRVSWVLPPAVWSEHPKASTPIQGADFTSRVLAALTSNSEVWSRTVFFLTFDENDGMFDHVPPPAPPSYNPDGTLAGGATLDLRGEYFSDPGRNHLLPEDTTSGVVRPWGLGPRVPMYVISPWSRGGWVNSQVFDHSSVAQFLEKRFRIQVPAISPWHRAVCGDLTSAFDFERPNDREFPVLPSVSDFAAILADQAHRPKPIPPAMPEALFQERGIRPSRALPYELHCHAQVDPSARRVELKFSNTGRAGAVFHVYDRLRLDEIPCRYTVEAGKALTDRWHLLGDAGRYDLWVCGPNGLLREFRGVVTSEARPDPEITLEYDVAGCGIRILASNGGQESAELAVRANAYEIGRLQPLHIAPGRQIERQVSLAASCGWYDFSVVGERFERRFAGRLETGSHSVSDPAMPLRT